MGVIPGIVGGLIIAWPAVRASKYIRSDCRLCWWILLPITQALRIGGLLSGEPDMSGIILADTLGLARMGQP